jgi:hypothetical protein
MSTIRSVKALTTAGCSPKAGARANEAEHFNQRLTRSNEPSSS